MKPSDYPIEDEYADAFLLFYTCLTVLAETADKQCEIMGNFNVAWELRDDAARDARAVLSLAGTRLSEGQQADIRQLLADVASVPDSVVNVSNIEEEQMRAMGDPCWTPIRLHARKLMSLLRPEMERIGQERSSKSSDQKKEK